MELNTLFPAFLLNDYLKNIDNKELIRYAYELKDADREGVVKSNFIGWQSDNLVKPNDEIQNLVDTITEKLEAVKVQLGFLEEAKINMINLWINVNDRKSSFNRPHVHPGATFSGVYYVKCNEQSGKLVFKHPSIIQQYTIPENTMDKWTNFLACNWSVLPEEGKLMIFPSWLEHYVEPNVDDEIRISIAFNADIHKD